MYYSPSAALCYEFMTNFPLDSLAFLRLQSDFAPECLRKEGYLTFLQSRFPQLSFLPAGASPFTNFLINYAIKGDKGFQELGYESDDFYSEEWRAYLERGHGMFVYGLTSSDNPYKPDLANLVKHFHYHIYLWVFDKSMRYSTAVRKLVDLDTDVEQKRVWDKCFDG